MSLLIRNIPRETILDTFVPKCVTSFPGGYEFDKRVDMAVGKMDRGKKGASKSLGRIPLPRKAGHPQTTKKGKHGYNRKREKKRTDKEEGELS